MPTNNSFTMARSRQAVCLFFVIFLNLSSSTVFGLEHKHEHEHEQEQRRQLHVRQRILNSEFETTDAELREPRYYAQAEDEALLESGFDLLVEEIDEQPTSSSNPPPTISNKKPKKSSKTTKQGKKAKKTTPRPTITWIETDIESQSQLEEPLTTFSSDEPSSSPTFLPTFEPTTTPTTTKAGSTESSPLGEQPTSSPTFLPTFEPTETPTA